MSEPDIFGLAFRDYLSGETDGVIQVVTDLSEPEELPVGYFFRAVEQMPSWEQLVLDRCRGRVLDAGAGAGCHALALQDKGLEVVAIDRSEGAAEVMRQRGVKQAYMFDFFQFGEGGFDTIIFLMNGAGMAGTLGGLKKLLTHAKRLLHREGTIYLESTDLMYLYRQDDGSALIPMGERYYGELHYRLGYKRYLAPPFPWLFVDPDNLDHIAGQCGMQTKIIFQGESYNYVAEMVLV